MFYNTPFLVLTSLCSNLVQCIFNHTGFRPAYSASSVSIGRGFGPSCSAALSFPLFGLSVGPGARGRAVARLADGAVLRLEAEAVAIGVTVDALSCRGRGDWATYGVGTWPAARRGLSDGRLVRRGDPCETSCPARAEEPRLARGDGGHDETRSSIGGGLT